MYRANLTMFSIYFLDKFPRKERLKSRIKSRKQKTLKRTGTVTNRQTPFMETSGQRILVKS